MSSPTVVFLRNGLISALAALAIWLLPFLLRDDPAKQLSSSDAGGLGAEDSDLFQKSAVASLPEKPAKPKAQPQPAALEPVAASQSVTTRTFPAPVQARFEAPPKPVTETFEERIRKATLNDPYLARTTAQPVQPAVFTPRSVPEPSIQATPAVTVPTASTISLTPPPLPARPPHRLSFIDEIAPEVELRSVQAAVQRQRPETRVAATASATAPFSFVTNLFRRREPAAGPASASAQPRAVATTASLPVASLAATPQPHPAAASVQPRPAAPRWKPASCDDRYQFWK